MSVVLSVSLLVCLFARLSSACILRTDHGRDIAGPHIRFSVQRMLPPTCNESVSLSVHRVLRLLITDHISSTRLQTAVTLAGLERLRFCVVCSHFALLTAPFSFDLVVKAASSSLLRRLMPRACVHVCACVLGQDSGHMTHYKQRNVWNSWCFNYLTRFAIPRLHLAFWQFRVCNVCLR